MFDKKNQRYILCDFDCATRIQESTKANLIFSLPRTNSRNCCIHLPLKIFKPNTRFGYEVDISSLGFLIFSIIIYPTIHKKRKLRITSNMISKSKLLNAENYEFSLLKYVWLQLRKNLNNLFSKLELTVSSCVYDSTISFNILTDVYKELEYILRTYREELNFVIKQNKSK